MTSYCTVKPVRWVEAVAAEMLIHWCPSRTANGLVRRCGCCLIKNIHYYIFFYNLFIGISRFEAVSRSIVQISCLFIIV